MIRLPHRTLRPFVKNVWVAEYPRGADVFGRERALPDGHMHLVLRLSGAPIRIFDAAQPTGSSYDYGVIGGARAGFYTRAINGRTLSIGATLLPGASPALFGAGALEFAHRHTRLTDVWGTPADRLRERLIELAVPEVQLELFETFLLTRLPEVRGVHPAVAQALADLRETQDVRTLVARSGVSHRRLIDLFGNAVGLTPKRYARVLRFKHMLKLLAREPAASWADLAQDGGYSDQAHFNHEFREFSGLTPQQYRAAAPESPSHVPVAGPTVPSR